MDKLIYAVLILLLWSCQDPTINKIGKLASGIALLVDEYWEYQLKEFPLMASSSGVNDYNDQLGSFTEDDFRRRNDYYVDLLARVNSIDDDRDGLSLKIDLELLKYQLKDQIARYKYKAYLNPILADAGFHISFSFLPGNVPFNSVEDYNNYIQRLRLFLDYANQHIELMRKGIAVGITQPLIILKGYDVT